MSNIPKEIQEEQDLIKTVFATESGKKLLKNLSDQYVWTPQIHPDPNVMYSRLGVQELIIHFLVITGANK